MFDSKMSGANQVHSTNGKTWNISNIFLLSSHKQIMLYVGHHELIILIICNPYISGVNMNCQETFVCGYKDNCHISGGSNIDGVEEDTLEEQQRTYLSLEDYDCIGFDLDHTLCRYNVGPMIRFTV